MAADGDGRGNVQMDGAHVRGQAAAAECEQGGAADAAPVAVLLHKRMGLLSVSSPAADRARQKDVQDMEYAHVRMVVGVLEPDTRSTFTVL